MSRDEKGHRRRLDPAIEKTRAKVTARLAVAISFKEVALERIVKCEREGRAEIT
ncbi:hypothetical protein NDN01_20450 [Sphingomonas sp. QA11]|uniref:hypothetical protein n=1 Tax=Sphingomonas sp. QA11 TaxID=2950605 RepID=UPI00234A65F5|nr:hypothetical protein [Sphingomonas sp. QA11]WCM26352.1 hypothetical protein NDN01_20450 [Sphingomonas sp. QA11]